MALDDRRSGLGALIAAFLLCMVSLGLVVWFVAVSSATHGLYAATSTDAPEPAADISSGTRTPR